MLGLFNMVFGVSICDGEWLVVMGRLVGDCGCFLQVVDIVVVFDCQGQGLGKVVMGVLDVWLCVNVVGVYVSLIVDGQVYWLYVQFGFVQIVLKLVGMVKVVG